MDSKVSKALPNQLMLPNLIKNLKNEIGLDMCQSRTEALWKRYEEGYAHFVVEDNKIVGSCVIWDSFIIEPSRYTEMGTVWAQKQNRNSILEEIYQNINRICQGKKILGFCHNLILARYFVRSKIFPFNKIARLDTCSQEVISAYQLEGWHPDDLAQNSQYTRVLFREANNEMTAWYMIYEQ